MVKVLQSKGIPVSYVPYEGEGHGFRKAENIQHSFLSELAFYGKAFQFEPSDSLPDLTIL
jgi:dipeptidyl aminopeptidase/acylaminoacyl peptidase